MDGAIVAPRYVIHEKAMPHRIRKTEFTWDPETESRSHIWETIKAHMRQELDRIHAAAVLQRRLARRRAHPQYERIRQIMQATQRGESVEELARIHGIRPQRVRDVILSERRWYTWYDTGYATLQDEHPVRHDSTYEMNEMPPAQPQTIQVMPDP